MSPKCVARTPARDTSTSFFERRTSRPEDSHLVDDALTHFGRKPAQQLRRQKPQLSGPGRGIGAHHESLVLEREWSAVIGDFVSNDFPPPANDPSNGHFLDPATLSEEGAKGRGEQLWVSAVPTGPAALLIAAKNTVSHLAGTDSTGARGCLRTVQGITRDLLHIRELNHVPNRLRAGLIERDKLAVRSNRTSRARPSRALGARRTR